MKKELIWNCFSQTSFHPLERPIIKLHKRELSPWSISSMHYTLEFNVVDLHTNFISDAKLSIRTFQFHLFLFDQHLLQSFFHAFEVEIIKKNVCIITVTTGKKALIQNFYKCNINVELICARLSFNEREMCEKTKLCDKVSL